MNENRVFAKFSFHTRVLMTLTKRHILVFFRNWTTVLFTMMVPMIVLIIYAVFLRRISITSIDQAVTAYIPELMESQNEDDLHKIYALADSWMMSGVLAVSSFTVSLNTNYILVRDKDQGINKDFMSSPISNRMSMYSYLVFNTIITFLVNFLVLGICMIYLAGYGAFMISFVDFLALMGILFLSVFNSSLLTFFICSFIKTESTLSAIVAIGSAAYGFLIGAYFPASVLPSGVRYVTGFFPGTYAAALFRNYFMSGPMGELHALLTSSYPGQVDELFHSLQNDLTLNVSFFDNDVPANISVWVLIIFTALFLIINLLFSYGNYLRLPKFKKKKTVQK